MTIKFKSRIALALGLALTSTPLMAQESMKIHLNLTENSPLFQGLKEFERLVEERTSGAIDVQIYPGNALGDDVEAAQQIQFGAIQAAPLPTAVLSNFNPSFQLVDLPFLFPNAQIAHEVLDAPEVGGALIETLGAQGFVGTSFWENGFKQLTCNNPINSPTDYAGRKVRVMQSPLLIAQFETMGATTIPIAFSELYGALQQGVVECQENPLFAIDAMRYFEVQDYLTVSNHGYTSSVLVFSKVWFDAQPPKIQEVLMTAAREATVFEREKAANFSAGILDKFANEKLIEITELTDDQRQVFLDAMQPVHERFADSIGVDLLKAATSKIEELSAK